METLSRIGETIYVMGMTFGVFILCAVVILFIYYLAHGYSYQWSWFDYDIFGIVRKKIDIVFYGIMDILFGGKLTAKKGKL